MKLLQTQIFIILKLYDKNFSWVDGYTDSTDFHTIFTDFDAQIRINLVKIREIRIAINPI
ncbi:MAG: hypothetical protein RIS64_3320 [Bacteroidota bacterium]|jgi:hypothetical protein